MSKSQTEAGEVLQPMLDLFSGADGGVGFSNLRHNFVPEMLQRRGEGGQVDEFIKMLYQMSRLCELMMEKK